jgi:hypothetical protein
MNFLKLILFSFLFCSISATAQYGNNAYGSNGGRARTNQFPQSTPKTPSAEDIEKEKNKKVDELMIKLKEELTLDELQLIAIKNEIVSSSKSIEIVMKKDFSDEDKSNEIKSIREKTDKAINSYLNPSQKEKYQKLKEEKVQNKDDKKKKEKEKKEKEND